MRVGADEAGMVRTSQLRTDGWGGGAPDGILAPMKQRKHAASKERSDYWSPLLVKLAPGQCSIRRKQMVEDPRIQVGPTRRLALSRSQDASKLESAASWAAF